MYLLFIVGYPLVDHCLEFVDFSMGDPELDASKNDLSHQEHMSKKDLLAHWRVKNKLRCCTHL